MLNCVAQHAFAGRLQSAHEAANQQRLQKLEAGVAEVRITCRGVANHHVLQLTFYY